MNTSLIIGTVTSLALVGGGTIPAVLSEATRGGESLIRSAQERAAQTQQSAESTVQTATEDVKAVVNQERQSQKERIEAKKSELKERLDTLRAERAERLEGRRLAQCQNRQSSINELLANGEQNGRDRLARIQKFEAAVKTFYEDKQLTSDRYDEAANAADAAEAEAIAALDSMSGWTFDCSQVDGAKPSQGVAEIRMAKHDGLRAYRDSVISLLQAVKEAFALKQQENGDA